MVQSIAWEDFMQWLKGLREVPGFEDLTIAQGYLLVEYIDKVGLPGEKRGDEQCRLDISLK